VDEPGDGAGAPPWLPVVGTWFLAAALLLAMPRMWVPAAFCGLVGASLRIVSARAARRRNEGAPGRGSTESE
jgi:hypothetical protein